MKLHPLDLSYNEISHHRRIFSQQNTSRKTKEVSVSIEQLIGSLKSSIVSNEQRWKRLAKVLDNLNQDQLYFNDFLKLLEREAYYRSILAEHQLYYQSVKRIYFKNEYMINKQQGRHKNGTSASDQQHHQNRPSQSSYAIDHIKLFKYNNKCYMICAFVNKITSVIEYETGHIVYDFVFRGDNSQPAVQQQTQKQSIDPINSFSSNLVLNKTRGMSQKYQPSSSKNRLSINFDQQLQLSPKDKLKQQAQARKQEIMNKFKLGFTKKIVLGIAKRRVEESIEAVPQSNAKRKAVNSLTIQNIKDDESIGKEKVRNKSKQQNCGFSILGIDSLLDENKAISSASLQQKFKHNASSPNTVVSNSVSGTFTTNVPPGGQVQDLLKKSYAFGLDEKLFTPQNDRDRGKSRFNNFMKKLDADIKITDRYFVEKRLNSMNNALGRKNTVRAQKSQSDVFQFNMEKTSDAKQKKPSSGQLNENISSAIDLQTIKNYQKKNMQDQDPLANKISHLRTKTEIQNFRLNCLQRMVDTGKNSLDNSDDELTKQCAQLKNVQGVQSDSDLEMVDVDYQNNINKSMRLSQKSDNINYKGAAINNAKGQVASPKTMMQNNIKAQLKQQLNQGDQQQQQYEDTLNVVSDKVTYPMCIKYYEPLDLLVFALANRQLEIYKIKQTGIKQEFIKQAIFRTDSIVVCMDVQQHKVSDKLLICVGCQNMQVLVLEFNQHQLFQECKVIFNIIYKYPQVTCTMYRDYCGLIVTSFGGNITIYDPIDFTPLYSNNGQYVEFGTKHKISISVMDCSRALDLIAFSGVQGKVGFINATTRTLSGVVQAHSQEIIGLQFYDEQYQFITVSNNGVIGIWDAQKLENIQLIKLKGLVSQTSVNSTFFYSEKGLLFLANSKIFQYQMEEDIDIKVQIQQKDAIARDYLEDILQSMEEKRQITNNMTMIQNKLDRETTIMSKAKQSLVMNAKVGILKQLSIVQAKNAGIKQTPKTVQEERKQMSSFEEIFDKSAIKRIQSVAYQEGGHVLASKYSKLIGFILHESEQNIYLVDSDQLIRVWSLKKGIYERSYYIQARHQSQSEKTQAKLKVTAVFCDHTYRYLAVGYENGYIQINNLFSGTLLYNEDNVMKLDFEICSIKFFQSQCNFWMVAACWDGRVAFFSKVQSTISRNQIQFLQKKSTHTKDVISFDINENNNLATASADNTICFWNTYIGSEQKSITLPQSYANGQLGHTIQRIRYLKKELNNYLLIFMNKGEIYILDITNEQLLNFKENEGSVPEFSSNDINGNIILSVSENGSGRLQTIQYQNTHSKQKLDQSFTQFDKSMERKHNIHQSQHQLNMYAQLFKFVVNKNFNIHSERLKTNESVIQVKLSVEHRFFIVAQLNGRVSLFNQENCQKVCILNQSEDWPQHYFQGGKLQMEHVESFKSEQDSSDGGDMDRDDDQGSIISTRAQNISINTQPKNISNAKSNNRSSISIKQSLFKKNR